MRYLKREEGAAIFPIWDDVSKEPKHCVWARNGKIRVSVLKNSKKPLLILPFEVNSEASLNCTFFRILALTMLRYWYCAR